MEPEQTAPSRVRGTNWIKQNQNKQNLPESVEQTLDRTQPELTEPPGVHRANAELNGTRTNSTFQISWNKLQKLNRTRTNRTFQSPQSEFIIKWNQNSPGGSELTTHPSDVKFGAGGRSSHCAGPPWPSSRPACSDPFCRGDCWRQHCFVWLSSLAHCSGGRGESASSSWTTWTTSRTLTSPGSC